MTIKFIENLLTINEQEWEMKPFKFLDILKIGVGVEPSWQDIIISGNTALTLVNAKEDGLNYLKLFGNTEQLAENYIDSVTLEGKCEQSGTPTPTVPVDIVCNNGAIKYSANMANVNAQTALIGYYISSSGVVTADIYNWIYQDFIPVLPNTTYTLSFNTSVYYVTISEYSTTSDSGFVTRKAGQTGNNTKLTITTGSTTNFIRFGTNIDRADITLDRVLAIEWMLNKGSVTIPYTPYIEGDIYTDGTVETATDNVGNVATAEMLLAIDDNKDEQNVTSGGVIRNIGYVIFDGSETFTTSTAYGNACLIQGASSSWDADRSKAVLCTHFLGMPTTTSKREDYTCFFNSTGHFYFRLEDNTVATFKQFLADQYNAGTPVIVFFVKAEPTTETVTGQFLSKEPVTVTGSLTGLVANVVSSSHTTPTPTQPLPINTNNGVLTFGVGNTYTTADGQGTFVSPAQTTTTRIYKAFGQLQAGKYKVKITGNFEFIFQYKDTMDLTPTTYGNIGTWTTEGEYELTDENLYYGVAIRNAGGSGNIYPSNFNNIGSIGYSYLDVIPVGTVETVEVTGKNLYNASADTVGYAIDANGNIVPASNACYSSAIPVTIGEYTYSGICSNQGGSNNKRIHGYMNGVWVQQLSLLVITAGVPFSHTFTVPDGINEIRVSHWSEDTNSQIELGSTATTYEPYYNGGSATAEMLLGVGDYQDVQSVLDGVVTRNLGIKVLDGTNVTFTRAADNKFYPINSSDWAAEYRAIDADHNKNYIMSNQFASHTWNQDAPASSGWSVSFRKDGANSYIRFLTTGISTVAEFNTFLTDQYNAGTPVIVVYPLATPTTETVTGQQLTIQAGTNIVEITQASIDNLGLEVSYKAGVAVTVTEVQNAQLDNTVTVTIGG